MSHRFIAHVLSSAAVAIGPNSKLFGSKLHATNHKGLDSLQVLFLPEIPKPREVPAITAAGGHQPKRPKLATFSAGSVSTPIRT